MKKTNLACFFVLICFLLFFVFLILFKIPIENKPLTGKVIIAHRGASELEKENTLSSFQKAVELNASMIEFDVRKTKDNVLIVFHDGELNKNKINKLSYEEIESQTDFHVPKLEETLKLLENKSEIIVDLKEQGYEEEVIKIVALHFNKENFIFSSIYVDSLIKIKEIDSGIKTGLIIGTGKITRIPVFLGILPEEKIKKSEADYIIVYKEQINKIVIEKAEKLNKDVLVFGIETKEEAEKAMKIEQIKGLISDYL